MSAALRAPPRGRYDRLASASERAHGQRELIVTAAQRLLLESPPAPASLSVSDLCAATGLGRNTIYGHFASVDAVREDVLTECTQPLLTALARSLDVPSTPLDELRRFCHAWVTVASVHPEATLLAARWRRDALSEALSGALERVVLRGVAAGAFAPDRDRQRTTLLTSSALTAAELAAQDPGRAPELVALLVDVLSKANR